MPTNNEFIRPVRKRYIHIKCLMPTEMELTIAEAYARDPKFNNGLFCSYCKTYSSQDQFTWDGTNEKVGS